MGFFTAKPKKALHDIPLTEVVFVSEPVKDSQIMTVLQAAIAVRDRGWARIEFPQVAMSNGAALLAELGRRVGPTG